MRTSPRLAVVRRIPKLSLSFFGGGPIVGRFFDDLLADVVGGIRVSFVGKPELSNLVKNGVVSILLACAGNDGGVDQLFQFEAQLGAPIVHRH
ncbi:conserved hypothetical protein [Sinorhizobium medicae]|uniref:Uncharacterized protein n=1 Tax=Sinorhizobium medicae TaxID=110321 RepID=A0A508WQ87_9HYPH|nr:conserved hypothetical protein [Sinorhizobium medicae]